MPELPEVETVRRGLSPFMEGRSITHVKTNREGLRIPFPDNLKAALEGVRVERLSRRAKYVLAHMSGGGIVVFHLGMSGQMRIEPDMALYVEKKHDHLLLTLEGGSGIVFNDPRRFGMVFLTSEAGISQHPSFHLMGPEPLGNEFSGPVLRERLKGKRTPIKIALLDQHIVAGVGNIYASEALHDAGISPFKAAGSLTAKQAENLVQAIRDVLSRAIASGGSSLKDFIKVDGKPGYFQHSFAVYDRADQPCPRCHPDGKRKNTIQKIVQGGRATYYCKSCQK